MISMLVSSVIFPVTVIVLMIMPMGVLMSVLHTVMAVGVVTEKVIVLLFGMLVSCTTLAHIGLLCGP